jgi:hypothetical protein
MRAAKEMVAVLKWSQARRATVVVSPIIEMDSFTRR